ncbi:hypothetical protein LTR91_011796 [Friedmanniomyces endolithicus]|uniref:Cytidyltransferase-like domain-containing protein n=1 Tax=Friedmanniomyces endolithicus TaxID=329885 RepID=A0AAN6KGI6_9PEZI|nr:hypothetical protein LTR03_006769 [Friedmanniomyces endolithicus]KAK0857451.1 hypothetical protein LTS02_010187 [Friedmanniomyces endolithicus]KAK0874257.1 hypothetical protein LTR87_011606 [Friedmanniomyces endolithicus]KAK0903198.1 hypothetical protein LTR57_019274 [Friedmanniomyces endolithicus]KAK0958649.1 hypothetical protein LTS01_021765 [Friedmanniomyces endolithicus]
MDSPEAPRFILFLPPVPSPPSLKSLKAAFGDTISQVLKEVASHSSDSQHAAILEVALAIPELSRNQHASRSTLYDGVQASVAAVYKLVCVIAAQGKINVEDSDGVDVRVLLIAWSPVGSDGQPKFASCGPVVGLDTLARCGRQWQFAFGVESDAGEKMVKAFVSAKGSREQDDGVQSTSTKGSEASEHQQGSTLSRQRNQHVAVGGTFDHLHIGHKLLLTMTVFAVDEAVKDNQTERSATIGITGDQLLVNKKHAEVLESWSDRQEAVRAFLDSILNFNPSPPSTTTRNDAGPNGKSVDLHYPSNLTIKCTEIQDPFGPTITDEQISALIISGETRSGGKAVNDKRKEKGWKELEVFEVDVLDAEEELEGLEAKEGFGSKLSSTAIREKLARQTDVPGTSTQPIQTLTGALGNMALRNLIHAKITGANAIHELDTIDCFTDDWETEHNGKLAEAALEIHLACQHAASECKAIVDILDGLLTDPTLGTQLGIFVEMEIRRENAMAEIAAVGQVAEDLAKTETSLELNLMEIGKRAKKLMGKLQGLKVQVQELEKIVEGAAVEQQAQSNVQATLQ